MSTVGIIGAMEVEVETLKKHMKVRRTVKKAHMEFCEGVLGGKEVVVVRTALEKLMRLSAPRSWWMILRQIPSSIPVSQVP